MIHSSTGKHPHACGTQLELDPTLCAAKLGRGPMQLIHRFGLNPRAVGESEWRDKLKSSYVRGKCRQRSVYGLPEGLRNY